VRILDAAGTRADFSFKYEARLIGGACLEAKGVPIEDETIARCRNADAVLLGAVGGPRWDSLSKDLRPERGLLALRKGMGVFANLRPVKVFSALSGASTLRDEVVHGIDILVVRELTGGIYFGEPKEIRSTETGEIAVDSMVYTTEEVDRIARVAFESARSRSKQVISVDKANVLVSSQLWRKVVEEVHKDYPDVRLSHMLVDNCAMQLVRNPRQFDVLLTTNMFGDILSDEAAMLTGSLGMLPSASLGEGPGLYEPAHGSAPDIAGQGVANPLAMIRSAALLMRYSMKAPAVADQIEQAVEQVLDAGFRTADLAIGGGEVVSTIQMGDLVLKQMAVM